MGPMGPMCPMCQGSPGLPNEPEPSEPSSPDRPPPPPHVVECTDLEFEDTENVDIEVFESLVKGLIDQTAGNACPREVCNRVDKCGSEAKGFYHEFEYNGQLVVATSGAPYHNAEHDAAVPNPNSRCERWQYMVIPLNPEKGSQLTQTGMGATGFAKFGGVFYNQLSNMEQVNDVAYNYDNEGKSLDSCHGHSSPDKQYHYHASPDCVIDKDDCYFLGFLRDGYKVFGGYCTDDNNDTLAACYAPNDEILASTPGYNFTGVGTDGCQLDEANGFEDSSGSYAYYMSDSYPWIPIFYAGSTVSQVCGIDSS